MRKKTQVVCHEKGGDAFYTTKKCNKVAKSKVLKIFGAGGLALIMGIGTLCGVLLLPIIAAQANANISIGEETLAPQEKLLFGQGLGLDPENDPILYTTESGLNIKFGAATLEDGGLKGYTYFTMGSYNGVPINWVIIGRHSSTASGTTIVEYGMSLADWDKETPYRSEFENWIVSEEAIPTPAGSAIKLEWNKQTLIILKTNYASISLTLSSLEATSDTIDTELDPGEILVLSEYVICQSQYHSTYGNNMYAGSVLESKMTALFESELGFTDAQKKVIMPQYLTNYSETTTYTSSAFLFPLANRGENFTLSTYLVPSQYIAYSLSSTTTASQWWLRSGTAKSYGAHVHVVETNGNIYSWDNNHDTSSTSYNGVRPAFVLLLD